MGYMNDMNGTLNGKGGIPITMPMDPPGKSRFFLERKNMLVDLLLGSPYTP